MRIRFTLLSGFGIGIVFGGAVRTLQAIGMQNAVATCLAATLLAALLMSDLPMSRPHPAQIRLLSFLARPPVGRFVDLVQIERAQDVRPGDDLFVPSLVARGWAEMGPRHQASVRITEAGRDALTIHGVCGDSIPIQERKVP